MRQAGWLSGTHREDDMLMATLGIASTLVSSVSIAGDQPRLRLAPDSFLASRAAAIVDHWLLVTPDANPAMLQMMRDRDETPPRDLVPWAGEYVGKYLTAACLFERLTGDPRLAATVRRVVDDLIATQAPDGYLGPWPHARRLTGDGLWDAWGHYHAMMGLMLYYDATGYVPALKAAARAGDLLCKVFMDGDRLMTNDGAMGQMNYGAIHGSVELYARTGRSRYLGMARWVVRQWERPETGQYLRSALEGKPVAQFPAHRWESIHQFEGMVALHEATGDPALRQAAEHIWWDMLAGDRHNTGGFSSGEEMSGNPYDQRAIETCCTVAWMAFTTDMLRLTGDPRMADELELSAFNSALGALPPSGRDCTYNTPMDGLRRYGQDLHWQGPVGGPDLSCCSVNAPRPLGEIVRWAAIPRDGGWAVNFYGPCDLALPTAGGKALLLRQVTDYPRSGKVRIGVLAAPKGCGDLCLRIPGWSERTTLSFRGAVSRPKAGAYAPLPGPLRKGDVVELSLDFRPWFWVGERECDGKASVYRGPILLTYDRRLNPGTNPDALPAMDARALRLRPAQPKVGWPEPWVAVRAGGGPAQLTLCDFATAGATGTPYRSWLPIHGLTPVAFSRDNPLRLLRP
jgi:hypothetical protein